MDGRLSYVAYLGYPAIYRPEVELAIFRSRVPNHYTTKALVSGTLSSATCMTVQKEQTTGF